MFENLCLGCMNPVSGSPCPHCGWGAGSQNLPHQLPISTLLGGKYLVGRALGQGGFGITYMGYDINLELKVAIKEYFPSDCVTRQTSERTVTAYSNDTEAMFQAGRDKFLTEAKALARFDRAQAIVKVKDFFMENGTAYIVMEFVEGITLKSYLEKQGRLTLDATLELLEPVFRALEQVHSAGMIHRDVSPDNIMLSADGPVLLDFGAARAYAAGDERSRTINVKMGYAPEEQYRTKGQQGPWTDVYALAATVYKAITGQTPVQAIDRLVEDELPPPSALGVALPQGREAALMKGLAVFYKDRFQSASHLYSALRGEMAGAFRNDFGGSAKRTAPPPPQPQPQQPPQDDERTRPPQGVSAPPPNDRTCPPQGEYTLPAQSGGVSTLLPSRQKAIKISSIALIAFAAVQLLIFCIPWFQDANSIPGYFFGIAGFTGRGLTPSFINRRSQIFILCKLASFVAGGLGLFLTKKPTLNGVALLLVKLGLAITAFDVLFTLALFSGVI